MECNEDMYILSVDVGFTSLGLVYAEVTGFSIVKVHVAEKVDLRDIPCVDGCCLAHSNNVVDRMAHFVAWYDAYFQDAEQVLIERQPLCGLVDIQALIYSQFRDKAILVSPNAMHKHFKLPAGEYDMRKEMVVRIATPFLRELHSFRRLARKHDVSDALCMILFVLHQQHVLHEAESVEKQKQLRAEKNRSLHCFDQFKFVKP